MATRIKYVMLREEEKFIESNLRFLEASLLKVQEDMTVIRKYVPEIDERFIDTNRDVDF